MKDTFTEKKLYPKFYWLVLTGMGCVLCAAIPVLKTDEMSNLQLAVILAGTVLCAAGIAANNRESKKLYAFIKEAGTFEHPFSPPLKPEDVLRKLEAMGFQTAAHSDGNYHLVKKLEEGHECNVFLYCHGPAGENADGGFYELAVRTMLDIASQASGGCERFAVNIRFGGIRAENDPEYMDTLRQGFSLDQYGAPYCFTAAYDTDTDILYYADAIQRVKWLEQSAAGSYIAQMTAKLFGTPGETA